MNLRKVIDSGTTDPVSEKVSNSSVRAFFTGVKEQPLLGVVIIGVALLLGTTLSALGYAAISLL